MQFTDALIDGDIEAIRKCPKADLHNHFVLGGSRKYLLEHSGRDILPITEPLNSMDEMHAWNGANIGNFFETPEGRRLLIKATFSQAKEDGVSVLEIGEDVWGLGAFFNNDIDELVDAFENAHREIAPEIELRLQIGMSRHCDIAYLEDCLSHFWGSKAFYSIDLYGDELAQPIENFIPIYRRAKAEGLRLKAHVGEWGTAEDVRRARQEALDRLTGRKTVREEEKKPEETKPAKKAQDGFDTDGVDLSKLVGFKEDLDKTMTMIDGLSSVSDDSDKTKGDEK